MSTENTKPSTPVHARGYASLRQFVEQRLEAAERMESHAIEGNHEREAARNNGKATAYEQVLRQVDAIESGVSA